MNGFLWKLQSQAKHGGRVYAVSSVLAVRLVHTWPLNASVLDRCIFQTWRAGRNSKKMTVPLPQMQLPFGCFIAPLLHLEPSSGVDFEGFVPCVQ